MSNPLVAQGTINRLRVHIAVPTYAELNVSPGYLGPQGVTISLGGNATTQYETMTGLVNSQEPYRLASVTIPLLRSQNLAALWRAQMESDSTIGDVTIHTDTSTDPDYTFRNCAMMDAINIDYGGKNPEYVITIVGVYDINSTMWNAL